MSQKSSNFIQIKLVMNTQELIEELQRLPVQKRIYVIEKVMRFIRRQEEHKQLEIAAENLYEDYKNDSELTAFTNLDMEDFYETR